MQELARGFQVPVARQFKGNGGEAGDGGDADDEQHQPGIFVFDFGNVFDVIGLGADGEP
ncbi:hypothetical protein D3C76_1737930 [compost metagenome]